MKNEHKSETRADGDLVALAATRVDGEAVPGRVLIVPWGEVKSTEGGFVVDAESAALVIEAFAAHGTDLPIDYEHQTLGGRYASPTGQAPAAGWVKGICAEEGVGLFAEVRWTDPAVEQLAAKQYRYLSPVVLIRKSDRRLVGLHSVALTNKPAIVDMVPIVNRMESDDEAAAAALAVLRERLELPEDCAVIEVLAAAERRLGEASEAAARGEAERRVEEVEREGRLTGAQREWALALARQNPEMFEEWRKSAPVVVPLGRTMPVGALDRAGSRRKARSESARAEFRACPELAGITSEEAYVAAAERGAD